MKVSIKKLKADMAADKFIPFTRYDLCDYIKSKYGKDGCLAVWNVGKDIFCKHEKCIWYNPNPKQDDVGKFTTIYAPPYHHCSWNW